MYKILRFYAGPHVTRTIKTKLTLEEAQAHCNDPETSSSTATGAKAARITRYNGAWFDGYEET